MGVVERGGCFEESSSFTEVHKLKPVQKDAWSALAPDDAKLEIAITRMLRLRAAGLTIEMAGSDFLVRRIAPLQDRALRMGVCWSCRCHASKPRATAT